MSTMAPNTPHALSGHNPTLFDVVVQYADMDMLRTLVLTSHSLYESLQHCRFDHLTMVVLEAPILKEQQQVMYNGADPVPADTFHLPLDAIASSSSCQTQTQAPIPTLFDNNSVLNDDIYNIFNNNNNRNNDINNNNNPFHAWEERSAVYCDYDHNFIIPDYARNFMTRARSVELVVYRLRLGTRISTFFKSNAHYFKHGKPQASDECTSCVESKGRESAGVTPQYKLHLSCLPKIPQVPQIPQAHGDSNDHQIRVSSGDTSIDSPSTDCCVFDKNPSQEFAGGGSIETCRLMAHMFPGYYGLQRDNYPFNMLPALQLRLPHHTLHTASENNDTPHNNGAAKNVKTANGNTLCPDGRLYINISHWNKNVYRPRFQNLPLVEHDALTKSLKIHIVDCVAFGAEDWRNAIPGCAVQPVQTWVIWDDIGAPGRRPKKHPADGIVIIGPDVFRERSQIRNATSSDSVKYHENNIGIGRHFPRLSSLVLQYSPLYLVNVCDSHLLRHPGDVCVNPPFLLSHFFIDGDIHMPHLHHFGVIGTMLNTAQFATIVHYNARVCSLTIDPVRELGERAFTITWVDALCLLLDEFEHSDIDDIKQCESPHQLLPLRKYNFSIAFASSYSEGCCPSKMHKFGNALGCSAFDNTPACIYLSQHEQHLKSCDFICNILSKLCSADTVDSATTHTLVVSPSLSLSLPVPTTTFGDDGLAVICAISNMAQHTLTHLEIRCHYCSYAKPGTTLFPGTPPGDYTTTQLAPLSNAPLGIGDSISNGEDAKALPITSGGQYDKERHMRLREVLRIPKHVVLRL